MRRKRFHDAEAALSGTGLRSAAPVDRRWRLSDAEKQGRKRLAYWRQITFWYAVLMLTVFLFYFDGNGYQQITRAKYTVFNALSGGYIAAMALVALDQIQIGALRPPTPLRLWRRAGWAQRLVTIYLALTWLSALCSPYWPETALGGSRHEGALTITLYGLCFLLVSVFGKADRRLLAVLGASVSLFCLLCLVQLAGWNPFGLYPAGCGYADAYTAYAGEFLGTLGNVDLVGAFLSLVIPILVFSLARLPGRRRFLLLIPLALAFAVLAGMSVLAGWLGVALGCLTAVPVSGSRNPCVQKRLALGVLALLAAGVAVAWAVDLGGELPHQLHRVLHGELDPAFGSGRLHIWGEVLRRIPGRLLLGAGPDTMAHAGLEPFTRYDPDLGLTLMGHIDAAHNEYLNILYHQGIFALGAYWGALGLLALQWVRCARKADGAAVLGAGVCGYCVQAFFGISMFITAPFFWLTLGLLAAEGGNSGQLSDVKLFERT